MAREVDDKSTRKALARIRRAKAAVERAIAKAEDDNPDAAEAARIELTDWEDEFMSSIEERLNTFGSAYADPSLGADGEALSTLQLAKLKEIEKKAKGKAPKGFSRGGGSSFKNKSSGFKRKGPARRSNDRDINEDVIAPVEETAPDPVSELHKAGLVRKGFTPEVIETPDESDEAPSSDETNEADESPQETAPRRGFRVIEGGKD
ncbi:hypothetical protein [Oceanicaulis sp. MMSF_3324]|uniref:hypothetical protein n=1 Tax=Oceanicaulis sp. MMSF_3324 TaxID=3046702 RepID=UPI00273F39FD|nr:hypothetical protein [Oceanicaulis sp. MMSF_3324]